MQESLLWSLFCGCFFCTFLESFLFFNEAHFLFPHVPTATSDRLIVLVVDHGVRVPARDVNLWGKKAGRSLQRLCRRLADVESKTIKNTNLPSTEINDEKMDTKTIKTSHLVACYKRLVQAWLRTLPIGQTLPPVIGWNIPRSPVKTKKSVPKLQKPAENPPLKSRSVRTWVPSFSSVSPLVISSCPSSSSSPDACCKACW